MGQTTPNIGIYIPAAGETGFEASFASGMVNTDQHDHSGAPNKGVPISTAALADNSVTYSKLAANVVDTTTGLDVETGVNAHKITTTGLLKSIAQNATASGFLCKNGAVAAARTLTGTANEIAITNPAGVAGDPVWSFVRPLIITGDVTINKCVAPALNGDLTITDGSVIVSLGDVTVSAGDLTVTTGSIIGNVTGGLTFDSTNYIQAYTTNSWTPVVTFGGASTGWSFTNTGKYWQIGNIVFFTGYIKITGAGVSTGSLLITGLPTPAANDGFFNTFTVAAVKNVDFTNSGGFPAYLVGYVLPATSNIEIYRTKASTADVEAIMKDSNFVGDSEFGFSGFYWTA